MTTVRSSRIPAAHATKGSQSHWVCSATPGRSERFPARTVPGPFNPDPLNPVEHPRAVLLPLLLHERKGLLPNRDVIGIILIFDLLVALIKLGHEKTFCTT